jgi:hypothetical protein
MNRLWAWIGSAALLGGAAALPAQVVVLNGPSTIGSDAKNGHALRIVSQSSGGATVSIRTTPATALVCDGNAPKTTCYAYVKPGERIAVSLRRPVSRRTPPGQGVAPKPHQWAYDCVGTTAPDCVVSMTQARTVMVDWGQ